MTSTVTISYILEHPRLQGMTPCEGQGLKRGAKPELVFIKDNAIFPTMKRS